MISGIDYYSGNGSPSLAGLEFAFIKATEGLSLNDPAYATQRARIKKAGLAFGAYHFGWENESVDSQAEHFVSVAKPEAGDMLFLDFEGYSDGRNWSGMSWAQRDAWRLAWIAKVKTLTHGNCRVGTYINTSTWKSIPSNDPGDFLFIAEYGVKKPNITHPWQFWQHGDSPVDQDYGNFANRAALDAWRNIHPTTEDDDMPQQLIGTIPAGNEPTVILPPTGSAWGAYKNRSLHLGFDTLTDPATTVTASARVAFWAGGKTDGIQTIKVTNSGGRSSTSFSAGVDKISVQCDHPLGFAIEVW